ncbi:LuxR C-terminal-related transcriptional regulator [Serratia fonticola]|uniref:LuxR C-terminal-related transcriptional regulator n=1 Tax=Serratia fonticola TaxID=47917 RepID=UPI0027FAD12F|nr:LuxR C-terminal-related transcriptional regulator [Serratia fonticola]MDQ7212046.1 LuxR C-terminal-related transcriptional regulator [Serratia fonticola]HBE9082899.1 response regulator transcription factor [Serratia fonticola]HBE9093388.1 response regulator transcription factor [Serratia fonticola]HBE9155751.1 response regulator transcription factor [Serratia fonticola]
MKSECHIVTNAALVSSCETFKIALKELLGEKSAGCNLVLSTESLFSAEEKCHKDIDLLIFSWPTHPADLVISIELLSKIRERYPNLMIMVMIEDCIAYLISSLKLLKIDTIISQKASLKEWRRLINLAKQGKGGCCQLVAEAVEMAPNVDSMKRNELILLSYIANGIPIKNIADLMCREIKTIKMRKSHAMRKLGIHNYAELVSLKSILI